MNASAFHRLNQEQLASLAVARCKRCSGAGKYVENYRGASDEYSCDCAEAFLARCDNAEFPERLSEETLGGLDWNAIQPGDARATLQDYADQMEAYLDESLGLILSGPVGCGKTHVAVGVAKIACALGRDALFVNVPGWYQSLRDSYAQDGSSLERDMLDEMKTADVLVLDDLGAEKGSDWARERLYVVVNKRSMRNGITLTTTNLGLEQLETMIGERSMSRLSNNAVNVDLTGDDYRRVEKGLRQARIKERAKQNP